MKKKRILICGATGFIGRNIAQTLVQRRDFEITGVYNRRSPYELSGMKWVKADLTDHRDVTRVIAGVDIIVQAAATTSGSKDIVTRPHIHVTDNAVMNSLLFRAAFEQKVGHVLFFSCTVMLQSSDQPQDESNLDINQEMHPRYFGAGWTKLYLEKMCEFYSRLGVTRYTAVRHTNIYGPHDKFDLERSHVFGATVTKVMTAQDGRIVVWGKGEEARDLLYVEDLVDFVERAIRNQQAPFALYNCGYGQAIPIKELVRKIIDKSGRRLSIEHDLNQPTIKVDLSLDCGKAERELGWKPRTSIDEGIAKTLAWWRQHVGEASPPDQD